MKKKPTAVEAAQQAVDEKKKALENVNDLAEAMRNELSVLRKALEVAQLEADALLPQCKMRRGNILSRRTVEPAVIIKQTPSGALMVRHVGRQDLNPMRFNYIGDGEFREYQKVGLHSYSRGTLLEVPQQFIDKAEKVVSDKQAKVTA